MVTQPTSGPVASPDEFDRLRRVNPIAHDEIRALLLRFIANSDKIKGLRLGAEATIEALEGLIERGLVKIGVHEDEEAGERTYSLLRWSQEVQDYV